MEPIEAVGKTIWHYLNYSIIELGDTSITVWLLLYFIFGIFLLFYLSGKFKKLLINRVLIRYTPELGVRQAIGTIVRYIIVFIGLLIILQTAGIDLSTLTVLAGALGIGIGFGLQAITNNFVSGIIILLERPIKVGDRIEVGGVGANSGSIHGRVVNISARATTIITNDNVSIIVPNSEFTSTRVINWSHNDEVVRFRIPVTVSYSSNVDEVIKLLLEVGKEDPDVLQNPPTDYRLIKFGDDGIHFELLVWTKTLTHRRGFFISNLNVGIIKKFNKHGITIPFPQRDLHMKSGFEKGLS
jgi:small-conductance mechanosensitive channel